jgi:hypothetical protein
MPRRTHLILIEISTDELTTSKEVKSIIKQVVEDFTPDEFVNSKKKPTRILKILVKDYLRSTKAKSNEHIRDSQ